MADRPGPPSVWEADSLEVRGMLGVSPNFAPWTSRKEFRGTGLPQGKGKKRVYDLVDISAMQVCKRAGLSAVCSQKTMRHAVKDVILDVSQSHKRPTYSNQAGVARCLCTSSDLYSYKEDRVLEPMEHVLMQGHSSSVVIPESLSSGDVRSIAGESIALPCLGCIIWAIYTSVGFPFAAQ